MSTMKYLADENFISAILRGLLRRDPSLDIIRVQDHGLSSTDDPLILDWAAKQNRVVLTHDVRTMPSFAYERIANGQLMSGMLVMRFDINIGVAIEDILLINQIMMPDELHNTILRLPI